MRKISKLNYNIDNKPIILHFWATWCPICKLEASNIEEISKSYKVITIAVNSKQKDIKNYLKNNNLNFRVINDNDNKISKDFNVSVFPTTLIYDKDKNLVFSEVGYSSTFGLKLRLWWIELF